MKKWIYIVLAVILVIGIAFGVIYAIDLNRMLNNEPVLFSTWGRDYAPPVNVDDDNEQVNDSINNNTEEEEIETGMKEFIGTVLEETTTYMIVEPNEGEREKKSADKIKVNYGVDHLDYYYGIGRKVLIRYSGDIRETYPAEIDTNDVTVEGYLEFDLTVEKSGNSEQKKVLSNSDISEYSNEYDLYYYGLNGVTVKVDKKEMDLEKALRNGYVSIDGILIKAEREANEAEQAKKENPDIESTLYPIAVKHDDGSAEYQYKDYKIIKQNTLPEQANVYIGSTDMTWEIVSK